MAPARARLARTLTLGDDVRAAYAGGLARGTFVIEAPVAGTVRAIGLAGFDFVVLDLEHSSSGVEALGPLIAEARAIDLPAVVRVWANDAALIAKVVDAGANGVMVPHVDSADAARRAALAARWSPRGERGVAPLIAYGAVEQRSQIDDATLVIVQLEGAAAIGSAAAIAAVDGVDALFVGPYDLAESLGHPGDVAHPDVVAAAEAVARDAGEGVMLGIYVDDPAASAAWAQRGFRLQCVSFDGAMLLRGARQTLA